MRKIIPYGKQSISKSDINNVVKVLKGDYLTTGPLVEKFEKKFRNKVNSKYAVSCSSGTAAIHLVLLSIKLKKGDNVIIPAINFISAANLVSTTGANIFLADVDKNTGQMSPSNLLNCIKNNNLKRIKAVFTMYNGGTPNNIKEIYNIKKKFNFFLIEDACHALGARYSVKKKLIIGDCKYSDFAAFSFHPVKSITTGEGGMVTTNKKNYFLMIKMFRSHGIYRNLNTSKKYNWSYKVFYPGYNYRLSDLSCSLGISQLDKLDKFIQRRQKIASLYNNNLKSLSKYLSLPKVKTDHLSALHLYIINFKLKNLKLSRDAIIQKLFKYGICTQVHYIPTFYHPFYKKLQRSKFIGALRYYRSCLSLPIYPELTNEEVNFICFKIKTIIKKIKKIKVNLT